MRRKRYQKRYRRRRGREILPYIIIKDKIYFGGKLQKGDGIRNGHLAKVIPLIGGVISFKK